MQVFIGLSTDLTDLTDEKGEWVGEMGAHTERIFGRTDGTDGTDFGSRYSVSGGRSHRKHGNHGKENRRRFWMRVA